MVRRISLVEEVINAFLNEIQAGEFSYGEKLPSQEELSKRYNVSRIVLREALTKLSGLGMITFMQGKGTYLNEPSNNSFVESEFSTLIFQDANNMKEVIEARQIIERETSFLAAERRTIDDLREIKETLMNMQKHKDDIKEFSKWDLEFHVSIAKASQNSVLQKFVMLLRDSYWSNIGKFFEVEGIIDKTLIEHNNIYEQIEKGNPESASNHMLNHLTYPEKVIINSLENKS